ncbi:MAG: hypothetical protein IT488_03690 [Gammaproteobacteria bacterium]|nr:hypothetical protein [Gammaproteobacteria bacterium]
MCVRAFRRRPLAVLLATFCFLTLFAGCAGGPQLSASVHHRALDLDAGALEAGGLAFVTPSVVLGKEEDKQVIALIFSEALVDQRPEITVVTLPETLGLINSNGNAEDYRRMYEGYRETGIFRRDYLAQIGRLTGARYVAQLNLAAFSQDSVGRLNLLGLRLLETKRASARLFFQIWDSASGKIAWEGVQEMNYAYDTSKEAPVTFRSVIEASALRLIEALPPHEGV